MYICTTGYAITARRIRTSKKAREEERDITSLSDKIPDKALQDSIVVFLGKS